MHLHVELDILWHLMYLFTVTVLFGNNFLSAYEIGSKAVVKA